MTLTLIIPSRGRPERAREAALSAVEHAGSTDTRVIVAVDGDTDPEYDADLASRPWSVSVLRYTQWRGMVGTLNLASTAVSKFATHVGFMGDDHRVRTPGWDLELMGAAGARGIAYGDDLNMGERLPTAVVLAAGIVRTLGYVAPPSLGHLYVDDFWRELGLRLGTLVYRDDIVIEHMHPTLGKTEWDEQYRRVNSDAQFEADETAWRIFRDGGELAAAVAKIKDGWT